VLRHPLYFSIPVISVLFKGVYMCITSLKIKKKVRHSL